MTLAAAVDAQPTAANAAASNFVVKVWDESRGLPGGTRATVDAYVVPASGVGWVDCKWRARRALTISPQVSPEHQRMLADWTGQTQSSIVRQVIVVADAWFAHCTELAERELAVVALAAEQQAAPRGPIGATGPTGPSKGRSTASFSGTGPSGPSAMPAPGPAVEPAPAGWPLSFGAASQRQVRDELKRQMETMRRAGTLPPIQLPSPSAGHEAVEGVFVPLAGETVFGTPESTGDGLGDSGDHVPKPNVGR